MAAAVALALLIAGCSSEDSDDKVTKSTTTTTSTTEDTTDDATDDTTDDADSRAQAGQGPWSETAASMRGKDGTTAEFDCPPEGTAGTVWGTNIYTDDSSVCTAAVQVGLITFDEGGTVTIEIAPGAKEYVGSNHNGVESRPYGTWDGSFTFPDADELEVDAGITWDRAANFYANEEGPVTVTCVADGTPGSVWGTGPFTADSSICTAALFAGEITSEDGGEVTFEFSEGLDSYEGGEANGVTTQSYGSYDSSFDFVG